MAKSTYVLSLDDDTTPFLDIACVFHMLLVALQWNGTILPIAGVDLQALLITF